MRKKILFVVTKSNFGGAQRYVYDLATALPKEVFDVVVAGGPAPDGKPGRLMTRLKEHGIRTILIPELARDVSIARDWRALQALLKLCKAEKPDIIHLNSSKAGGLGTLAARYARVPRIIFTAHGLAFDEKRSALQRILIMLATWATVLFAHTTIAISHDSFERTRRMPFARRKVHLIWNGIVSPLFLSKTEARRELRSLDPDIPEKALWIGSIGELHPNKQYITAIDALASLEDTGVHLVIIGEGELHDELREYAKRMGVENRVHFLGFILDAARYLRAFDTFVLPSEKEGLPYVLLEAGLAYVPVVATNIAGVKDIILNEFTGLLVPPGNAVSLATALGRTVQDATLARSLSDELLKRIRQNFSLETMLRKTTALYAPRSE